MDWNAPRCISRSFQNALEGTFIVVRTFENTLERSPSLTSSRAEGGWPRCSGGRRAKARRWSWPSEAWDSVRVRQCSYGAPMNRETGPAAAVPSGVLGLWPAAAWRELAADSARRRRRRHALHAGRYAHRPLWDL
jgi:hypothetical protein